MDEVMAMADEAAATLRAAAQDAGRRGDLETRVALLERLTEGAAPAPEDQRALIEALSELRRFRDAETVIDRFLVANPGSLELRVHLGVLHNRTERPAACCAVLGAVVGEPGAPHLASFLLGLNNNRLRLLPESIAAFEQLPPNAGGYWASERKRAVEAYATAEREAAEAPPGSAVRLGALAALGQREAFEAELATLDAAARDAPDVLAARSRFALREGGAAAAASLYAEACAERPDIASRVAWARHLADAGDAEAAVAILWAIPEAERPFPAWAMLARLLLLAGEIGPPAGFAESFLARFPLEREPNIAYVLAALESGVVERFVEPAAEPAERRRHPLGTPSIVQFWHGEPPADLQPLLESWRKENPELRHTLFDEPRARSFLTVNFGTEMTELFDSCYHPAMKSDLFRLAYLFLHGGIYADADDACLRPLGAIVDALDESECVLHLRTDVVPYLNNNFIAARPRARVIAAALRDVTDALRAARAEKRRTDIWFTTGPGALTRAAASALRRVQATGGEPAHVCSLITERHLATYVSTVDTLAYKKTPAGDWRVATGEAQSEARQLAEVFAGKYQSGSDWGGHSGFGSSPPHMGPYLRFVEQFIHLNGIRSVVDVGCGDWQFSRFINFGGASYAGFDVVPALIERNRALFGREGVRFAMMPDDAAALPEADLLIIKDVLQHLPTAMVQQILQRALPRFRYALITNSHRKLDAPPLNVDTVIGGFRPLDLTAPPFNLRGSYVLEFPSAFWELLRTLLVVRAGD